MNDRKTGLLILGNQLFPPEHLPPLQGLSVFMAEDHSLCTHYRYHKHKIILFLAAMRSYAELLQSHGANVHYIQLDAEPSSLSYEEQLQAWCMEEQIELLQLFDIEDKFFEERILTLCSNLSLDIKRLGSPLFMVTRDEFADYLKRHKKPFMKTFYEELRVSRNILMDEDQQPRGGSFSYDTENRKKLPKGVQPPPLPSIAKSDIVADVSSLVDTRFPDHPGNTTSFWLPTTRAESLQWLQTFFEQRFHDFGPYEDALSADHPFLFHSVLSPIMNLGLLPPQEVLDKAITYAEHHDIPLNSLEGFVRQILGWREFVRGIYQQYSEEQEQSNFWNHSRLLQDCWYEASTGVPTLDDAIQKALDYGYAHHIERLMVISNIMLLCEVSPTEVHRWFMELYVDSSDWVMGPNVYGMAQFSDGGIFATKPYICGSNYMRKMSSYPNGEWCDVVDGLYWAFVEKHLDFYSQNARTAYMAANLKRISAERKKKIYAAADAFKNRVTLSA